MDELWPQACLAHYRLHDKRSDLAAPTIFRDEHWPAGTVCNADGKTYYYKSDYMRAVKAAGCEILGSNERLPPRPPPKKFKLTDTMRREIGGKVQALDSPTRPKRPPRDYFGGSKRTA
jgi:hypothetical protein